MIRELVLLTAVCVSVTTTAAQGSGGPPEIRVRKVGDTEWLENVSVPDPSVDPVELKINGDPGDWAVIVRTGSVTPYVPNQGFEERYYVEETFPSLRVPMTTATTITAGLAPYGQFTGEGTHEVALWKLDELASIAVATSVSIATIGQRLPASGELVWQVNPSHWSAPNAWTRSQFGTGPTAIDVDSISREALVDQFAVSRGIVYEKHSAFVQEALQAATNASVFENRFHVFTFKDTSSTGSQPWGLPGVGLPTPQLPTMQLSLPALVTPQIVGQAGPYLDNGAWSGLSVVANPAPPAPYGHPYGYVCAEGFGFNVALNEPWTSTMIAYFPGVPTPVTVAQTSEPKVGRLTVPQGVAAAGDIFVFDTSVEPNRLVKMRSWEYGKDATHVFFGRITLP